MAVFTGHVGRLPLRKAGQLVAHSFVQSSWYLEQRTVCFVVHMHGNIYMKYFLLFTLKISLTLQSIKTNSKSSFSLDRTLLWIIAREKDLLTATLFSSYIWDEKDACGCNINFQSAHRTSKIDYLLIQFDPLRISCQSQKPQQPAQLVPAGRTQQLQTQLQSLQSHQQLGAHWDDKGNFIAAGTEVDKFVCLKQTILANL